jgi:mRNA interferase RelE/StbE
VKSIWKIDWKDSAVKDLNKLDKSVQKMILNFIEERIRPNPERLAIKLKGHFFGLKGLKRYRIGDYRIVCQMKEDVMVILIIAIGHQREIYA